MNKGEISKTLLDPAGAANQSSSSEVSVDQDEFARHFDITAFRRAAIAARKTQVMAALDRVGQSGQHQQGWSYATDSDVLDALRPALAQAGLGVTVSLADVQKTEHSKTSSGKSRILTTVRVWITLTCDTTGGEESVDWWGEGIDDEDKGIQKAVTNAEKSWLMKTFLVSSGADAEGDKGPSHPHAPKQQQRREKPAPKSSVADVTTLMTEAGVTDPGDIALVASAIVGSEVSSVFDLSSNDANKVKAIMKTARDLEPGGCADFLIHLASTDPGALSAVGNLRKAHKSLVAA